MTDNAAVNPAEAAAASGPKPWPRAAVMVAFAVMIAVAQNVLLVVAVLQFLWIAFAGGPNARIAAFARALGDWLRDVAAFQGGASEHRPFPWADWPQAKS
jgi:hypothetical protein